MIDIESMFCSLKEDKEIVNVLTYNAASNPTDGVVFLYCSWNYTLDTFRFLLDTLLDFPNINIYVYNIDSESFKGFSEQHNIKSNGYGEVYWLRESSIIFRHDKNFEPDASTFRENNKRLTMF